ncbi:MAG: EscU/YscU/HrcU family type III secretion system export apparatus switch protein [Armatimonadota bacterium]|nr:EscU/YscU/HrcU family type III secretion system export apparatus switch protein [Armatimonadota bacterium]
MEDSKTAVALRYAPTEGAAPAIVAKGDGFIADEILRIARENDVPLRQDPALAGALATLDVGQQIPPELFRAVAEVLAFVYKMNEKV